MTVASRCPRRVSAAGSGRLVAWITTSGCTVQRRKWSWFSSRTRPACVIPNRSSSSSRGRGSSLPVPGTLKSEASFIAESGRTVRRAGGGSGVRRPGALAGGVWHARLEAARRLGVAHRLRVADLRGEVAEQRELLHHAEVVGARVGGDGRRRARLR